MIKDDNPEINVEEVMQRIREEVAQRRAASCKLSAGKPRFSADVENPSGAEFSASKPNLPKYSPCKDQPVFQAKDDGRYHVNELICYHDQEFVNVAYRSALHRSPDSVGNTHYLNMLRKGCAKIDILGRLRYSKEGRATGVRIDGLLFPFLFQQIYRIPVLGRFIQIASVIWHLPHLERRQVRFESELSSVSEAHSALLSRTQKSVDGLQKSVDGLQKSKADLDAVENIKHQIQGLQDVILPLKAQAHDIKRNLLDQDRRLGLLLEEARKRLPDPISTEQIQAMLTEDSHRLDAMYASFEDRFRGTREDIKQRQSIYLPIVREARAGTADAPVLDLGCGRGEWLEVLSHEGLTARGVDLNRIFLEGCHQMGLEVVEQDAVAYLRSLKPNSIGAVTSFHLIEHLPLKTLISLMDETLRVLKPGGLVILETPNPANVQVGSCNFYFDPTHRNPLPGPLTQYLLEARGFSRTQFMPLHPYGETSDRLTEGETQVQRVFNQFFFGPQDYAILAYKA